MGELQGNGYDCATDVGHELEDRKTSLSTPT